MPVVVTGKGGPGGGGWVKLNDWGHYLLQRYNQYFKQLSKIEHNLQDTERTI